MVLTCQPKLKGNKIISIIDFDGNQGAIDSMSRQHDFKSKIFTLSYVKFVYKIVFIPVNNRELTEN